jgi:hypothetical protein
MSTAHKAGAIEKATGAGRSMATATLMAMTMRGRMTTTMGITMVIERKATGIMATIMRIRRSRG